MIEETEIQSVSLRDLQPSQLYISQEKLSVVQAHFDFSDPQNVEPIPYKVLDGQKVITDGHTRAFAAHLAGLEVLPAYDDPDELD